MPKDEARTQPRLSHVERCVASRERRKWIGGFEKSWGCALLTYIEEARKGRRKEIIIWAAAVDVQMRTGIHCKHAAVVGSARPMRCAFGLAVLGKQRAQEADINVMNGRQTVVHLNQGVAGRCVHHLL